MQQQTSKNAYFKEVRPTLSKRHSEVLNAMKQHPNFTNSELAEFLRWPINTVTPRVNELVKMGYVEQAEKRQCGVTGRTVIAWKKSTSPKPIITLPQSRQREWVFQSKSDPAKKYTVVDFTTMFVCSCPAFQNHKQCWHVVEARRLSHSSVVNVDTHQSQMSLFN